MYIQHFVPDAADYKNYEHNNDNNETNQKGVNNYDDDSNTIRHFNSNDPYYQPSKEYKEYKEYNSEQTFYDWLVEKSSIVDNEYFQGFIVFAIMINTILMGVSTLDFVTDYSHTWMLFHQIDTLFMFLFTLEMAMEFMYRGKALFNDPWLTFDVGIVLLTWTFIIVPLFHDFRGLRALRLIVK